MRKFILVLMMTMAVAGCVEMNTVVPVSDSPVIMQPVMQIGTKAPVTGLTFPDQSFVVSASVDGSTFFEGITFSKSGDVWKASPTKYWPQTGTTAFLAYSCPGLSVSTSWNSNAASGYTLASVGNANTIPDNRTTQADIMYAGAGNQTQHSGGVAMGFKHAQALLKFTGQAYTSYNSGANTGVTIESITMSALKYQGKLGVTLSGSTVTASWTMQNTTGAATAASGSWGLPETGTVNIGDGYMVLPQSAVAFTINYTMHKGGSNTSKSYTFTPEGNWEMANSYTYAIFIDQDAVDVKATVTVDYWNTQTAILYGVVNGHQYVDLGLRRDEKAIMFSSDVIRGSWNDPGYYFAWGDTEVRYSSYNVSDNTISDWTFGTGNYYPFYYSSYYNRYDKYNNDDGLITLEPGDDAAVRFWGGNWRMPDKEDMEYLASCPWTNTDMHFYDWANVWQTTYGGKGDFSANRCGRIDLGGMIPGNTNCLYEDEYWGRGYFWTRTRDPQNQKSAYFLYINYSGTITVTTEPDDYYTDNNRWIGMLILPVLELPLQ